MSWFTDWFGTKYYKLLYSHRNEEEAKAFLDRLLQHLQLPQNYRIVDVACGQGRHANYLAGKGFDVTGFDFSAENVRVARNNARANAHFFQHDMRQPFPVADFDVALNLFTSFGYFDSEAESISTIHNICEALHKKGLLVIDFFNAAKVIQQLVPYQQIILEGVTFIIKRKVENGFVVKEIEVQDGPHNFNYLERVQLLDLPTFNRYLNAEGFIINEAFGDYHLNEFKEQEAERLIIIAEKK